MPLQQVAAAAVPCDEELAHRTIDRSLSRSLRHSGHLHIRGDIDANVSVVVAGDLRVDGWIMPGCKVQVGGSLNVGGIENAIIRSDGGLTAHRITASTLRIGGATQISDHIHDCDLCALGTVTLSDGAIVGGRVLASDVVTCAELGETVDQMLARKSTQPRTTIVEISQDLVRDLLLADLDQRIEEADDAVVYLQRLWGPLLADEEETSTLSADEAAELAEHREELERAQARLSRLEQRYKAFNRTLRASTAKVPSVRINGMTYPGVEIRLGDRNFRFVARTDGPLTITPSWNEVPAIGGQRPPEVAEDAE